MRHVSSNRHNRGDRTGASISVGSGSSGTVQTTTRYCVNGNRHNRGDQTGASVSVGSGSSETVQTTTRYCVNGDRHNRGGRTGASISVDSGSSETVQTTTQYCGSKCGGGIQTGMRRAVMTNGPPGVYAGMKTRGRAIIRRFKYSPEMPGLDANGTGGMLRSAPAAT
ncbi:MAG: hypothetical protein AB7W44_14805 [Pyrinomonadaceae bacterium]